MLEAARSGDAEKVETLAAAKAEIDYSGKDGFTALTLAARNGHETAFKALLAANADVNYSSKDGFTALTLAARHGHVGMIDALVKYKSSGEHDVEWGYRINVGVS